MTPHNHPYGQEPYRDFAVKFLLTEIKYDVKFDSWLKQLIRNQESRNFNPNSENVSYAYQNDKAEDWLVRQIDSAVNTMLGELGWCTVETAMFDTDEILENPTEWSLHFHFSPAWRGKIRALKAHGHQYIVNSILYEWYCAENVREADRYYVKKEEALASLVEEARNEKVELEPFRL